MKVTYKIKGINCTACTTIIKMTLQDLKGVNLVDSNVDDKTVTVEFNKDKISNEEIITTLNNCGDYKVII